MYCRGTTTFFDKRKIMNKFTLSTFSVHVLGDHAFSLQFSGGPHVCLQVNRHADWSFRVNARKGVPELEIGEAEILKREWRIGLALLARSLPTRSHYVDRCFRDWVGEQLHLQHTRTTPSLPFSSLPLRLLRTCYLHVHTRAQIYTQYTHILVSRPCTSRVQAGRTTTPIQKDKLGQIQTVSRTSLDVQASGQGNSLALSAPRKIARSGRQGDTRLTLTLRDFGFAEFPPRCPLSSIHQ